MITDHMSSADEYHGIIVREGIRDQAVLDKMTVLGPKNGKEWTLVKVGVKSDAISKIIRLIQTNLLSENSIPYYVHFYRDDELIVVFPEKVFHLSTDEKSWREAVTYGESLGVPKDELDFRPCRVQQETF